MRINGSLDLSFEEAFGMQGLISNNRMVNLKAI